MEQQKLTRRGWPRITLVLPPWLYDSLDALAAAHMRDRKREALWLLMEAISDQIEARDEERQRDAEPVTR